MTALAQPEPFIQKKKTVAVIITLGETISCDRTTHSIKVAEQQAAINPLEGIKWNGQGLKAHKHAHTKHPVVKSETY